MKKSPLLKIFLALVLGIVAGLLTSPQSTILGISFFRLYDLIGTLFLNALSLVVIPLVISSIIMGTIRLGQEKNFSQLGGQTFLLFFLTNFVAVAIGATLVVWLEPGSGFDPSKLVELSGGVDLKGVETLASGDVFSRIEQILYRLVPSNIFQVITEGQMLGLIFFGLLFGFFTTRIDKSASEALIKFWSGGFEVMMLMTRFIMRALPLGVFGLMAKVVTMTGFDSVVPVGAFFGVIIAGFVLYMFLFLPFLLRFVSGVSPLQHFRTVTPALVTAFTTSSTAATLPVTIDCMERRGGVPNRICSFILPLGTTINLAGTALYATGAVLFIAQAYGVELGFANLMTILIMGVFTGLGMVAGIPSASLITIVVILQTLSLPADGIVLVLAVERVLDMCRTTVSVFTNTCCVAVVNAASTPDCVKSIS